MSFTPGTSFSGFTLKKVSRIDEINAEVFFFEHDCLGCPLLAIKNDDQNKTFAAAFNTIPTDSTGVAHILEHSVLMGSKKYPVKDVFGEIHKGGLMTFLNAMTGSDITYYPFATRNLKEYFNLMDIYCDVVFNPLLERTTFEQEGWHYHQESQDAPLQYQGVVYNEMKGAFSDPFRSIFHNILGGLMPGSTYAHESGGDPKNIPDLSYEDFCAFHRRHYHPSNGMFFVYGNAPLEEELAFLQDRFLSKVTERGERRLIEPGETITAPVMITDSYAVDQNDTAEKTFLAVGTGVTDVLDKEKNAAFQVIANILYNSDASPLKNAIVSSGLCKDFGGLYLSSSSFKTFMITYLVGSEAERRDDFLALYTTTLRTMAEEGLDKDLVLSELNKYEFSVREEASKAQRGLDLIGKAMVACKFGTDPFDSLVNDEIIRTIRQKAMQSDYFEDLIRRYLLDNQATVVVTLTPDAAKLARSMQEEEQRLQAHAAGLTAAERDELIKRTNELKQLQQTPNAPEVLAKLPQLGLADLPANIDFHAVKPTAMFGRQVLVSELITNRITYLDIGLDFSCLPARLLPWLNLFGTIITEIGTSKMDYIRFAKEVATCTGDFSHSLNTYGRREKPDAVQPVLWLHLKCLPDYLERSLRLVASILSDLSLQDKARIREIVSREFAWDEHSAQSEGYNLPMTRVFSHLSPAGRYNELFSGATAYLAVRELSRNYDRREDSFLADLQEIAALLFNRNNLLLAITADGQEIASFAERGGCIVDALAAAPVTKQEIDPLGLPDHEAFVTSAEVVFAAQGGSLLPGGTGYNGHFEVLRTYLSRDYLWNTVRQMGGAYGCFIQFSHITGNMALVSYRDPQVRKTYEAYNQIPGVVAGLTLPTEVLEQVVIGTYGAFDPHQSPAAKGASARNEYLSGIDTAYKQQRLREIVSTGIDDLRSFAPAFSQMRGYRAIIGNRAKIEADRDLFTTLTEL
ncbi:MAG: insulinase family protein [Desulfocapsaceae bacterium]|nr:insulinase family protein [Desulfocapsaceae bacterium]